MKFKWKKLLSTLIFMLLIGLYIGDRVTSKEQVESSNYIDIKEFGAIGDGKTDDTVAFQNASQEKG